MTIVKKRRIEIIALDYQRAASRGGPLRCPVCQFDYYMLTTSQAAELIQVRPGSIYRWLAEGKAHGIRTPGGQHRICRNSLFTSVAVVNK